MKLTIKAVTIRATQSGDDYLRVEDTEGRFYSAWDMALKTVLLPGATVEVEITTKGNFKNITKASSVAETPTPKPAGSPGPLPGKDTSPKEAERPYPATPVVPARPAWMTQKDEEIAYWAAIKAAAALYSHHEDVDLAKVVEAAKFFMANRPKANGLDEKRKDAEG